LDPLLEDANKRLQSKKIISEMQQAKIIFENNHISSTSDKFMYDRFEFDFSTCC